VRPVPAVPVAVAVSHVGVAERVLAGTAPRAAFDASFGVFFSELRPVLAGTGAGDRQRAVRRLAAAVAAGTAIPAAGRGWLAGEIAAAAAAARAAFPAAAPAPGWFADPHGGQAPRPAGKRWTTACFVRACAENEAALGWSPQEYAARTGWAGAPAVALTAAGTARLRWMMAMMGVYASGGGDLCQAARTALDRAAGRPRRRRAPVERDWLAAEVTDALRAARAALGVLDAGR